MEKIENVITNDEINDDTDEQKEDLSSDQDIEEEENEPSIIHDENDIIEDDKSIENRNANIDISVKEGIEEGIDESERYKRSTIDVNDDEQEMEYRDDG